MFLNENTINILSEIDRFLCVNSQCLAEHVTAPTPSMMGPFICSYVDGV